MLIVNLGATRRRLLDALTRIPEQPFDSGAGLESREVAHIIGHISEVEKRLVATVIDALSAESPAVADRDLSGLVERFEASVADVVPATAVSTRSGLLHLLEESRFKYLQYVFNKTHEEALAQKSIEHPLLGRVSLKNLIDMIWLHERHHVEQIEALAPPQATRDP